MSTPSSPPRTLYHGGRVLTLDPGDRPHDALVTAGERVLGLGPLADMRSLAGPAAATVDLDGAWLMPGLVDAHPHAMHFAAFGLGAVDLFDAVDFDDIVQRIAARAAVTPPGEWIVCTPIGEPHYFARRDHTALAERRMPDRHVLDRAAPGHPVWLMAWAPRTPNVCAFNSPALARLNLTRHTPAQVEHVWIEKDDDSGEPTGVLRGKVNNYYNDDPIWHALSKNLPGVPDALWPLAGVAGVQAANALGVTALYEAHAMMPPHLEAYHAIEAQGLLTARVVMAPELSSYAFATMDYPEAEVWDLLEYGHSHQQPRGEHLRTVGVTLSRGGPLSQGYLRMNDPYPGPFGALTRGTTFLGRHVERRVVEYCLAHDLRLNMVIGGYRDHDDFFRTLAETTTPDAIRPREWVLQHCYFTAPAHVRAAHAHGLHVTSSPSFVYGKADVVRERFPPAVAADFIALRSMMDGGLNVACGTDWGPANPWRQIALAETRESAHSGHHHLESGQGLERLQALHAFTRNGGGVMQWPALGRLARGGPADFVVVDRDPLGVDAGALAATRVLRTVLGGAAVYDAGGLQGGPLALPEPAAALVARATAPPDA